MSRTLSRVMDKDNYAMLGPSGVGGAGDSETEMRDVPLSVSCLLPKREVRVLSHRVRVRVLKLHRQKASHPRHLCRHQNDPFSLPFLCFAFLQPYSFSQAQSAFKCIQRV